MYLLMLVISRHKYIFLSLEKYYNVKMTLPMAILWTQSCPNMLTSLMIPCQFGAWTEKAVSLHPPKKEHAQ